MSISFITRKCKTYMERTSGLVRIETNNNYFNEYQEEKECSKTTNSRQM